jgi:hypothetical protein
MAKCDDLDFKDTLSEYIRRIEKAEKNANLDLPIITSHDLPIKPDVRENITREQIGWRLYKHPMFYVVTVKEGREVRRHSHGEDVFRYIIDGSLNIYVKESEKEGSREICRTVNKGEWVVVRAHRPYRIETGTVKGKDKDKDKRHGYVALVAYQMACKPK